MDEKILALKKLREEISKNKASFKLLVDWTAMELDNILGLVDPNERIIRIANKLKELGVKEMEYELVIEKERVRKVISEYEELHPQVYESCPICLEDIRIHSSAEAQSFFSCCGNWVCKPCADSSICVGKVMSCPLCRETIPHNNPGLYNKRLLKCAERGIKWAQFQVACKYEHGQLGGRANMKKALKLYMLSAEQGHPPALLQLGRLYRDGVPGLVKKSAAKAIEYELQAANLGSFHAMANVSCMCFQDRQHGLEDDFPKAGKYATLASFYSTDDSADIANTILGIMFLYGQDEDGLGKKSYNLATHYLGIAVKSDPAAFNGEAAFNFSGALVGQAEYFYAGMHLNGRNILPRAAYWLRKSIATGHEMAKEALDHFELKEVGKCSACGEKEESSDKKFLRCGRCKIYWYCSKECQVASWNVGHKLDCKSTFC